ncbi:XkdX family protein [Anaerotignum sp.]
MNFDTIKKNYEKGLWPAAMVKLAVRKGLITKEEYTKITGEEY